MTDIYQGDPKLTLSVNGASVTFKGGQPVMDKGLENLALISLFTLPGWAGNVLFSDANQQIASTFLVSVEGPINLGKLVDIEQAARLALDNPAFGNVDIVVSNPEGHRINVVITIHPPGDDIKTLTLTKNGPNWLAQSSDPAYRRI
jgi:hypothetical protein